MGNRASSPGNQLAAPYMSTTLRPSRPCLPPALIPAAPTCLSKWLVPSAGHVAAEAKTIVIINFKFLHNTRTNRSFVLQVVSRTPPDKIADARAKKKKHEPADSSGSQASTLWHIQVECEHVLSLFCCSLSSAVLSA